MACFGSRAQNLIASATTIESCNDGQSCLNSSNFSYLFYNETNGEFYLSLDFSDFRKGADTNDNWLNQVKDTVFYFKGLLSKESFPPLGDQATRDLKLTGEILYNNTWRKQDIEMSIFTVENSILNTTNPGTNLVYDNYKVTFTIPFIPKDFKTYKKLYYTNQTVNITVTLGRINLLRPGMEALLEAVNTQSPR